VHWSRFGCSKVCDFLLLSYVSRGRRTKKRLRESFQEQHNKSLSLSASLCKGERDMCGCLHARFITSIRLLFHSKPVMSQLTPFIFCFSRKSRKPGSPQNHNTKLVKLNKRSPKVNPRKVQQDLSQKQPRHKIMRSAYLRHVMASLCRSRSHPVSVKKSRRLTAAG